jgi:hypothetical protein
MVLSRRQPQFRRKRLAATSVDQGAALRKRSDIGFSRRVFRNMSGNASFLRIPFLTTAKAGHRWDDWQRLLECRARKEQKKDHADFKNRRSDR